MHNPQVAIALIKFFKLKFCSTVRFLFNSHVLIDIFALMRSTYSGATPFLMEGSACFSKNTGLAHPFDGKLDHCVVTPGAHLNTRVGERTPRVKCPAQEHNSDQRLNPD